MAKQPPGSGRGMTTRLRTAEGRKIRTAFVSTPGHKLLSADYRQIELRVLAHVADIPALKEAFATQQLVHRGGHDISLLAWCAACAVWAWSLHAEHRRIWRKPLSYLVLATLATTLLVAWI